MMVIVSPAFGETFEDRWPYPVSVDPAPIEGVWPKLEKPKKVRKHYVFVCQKRYYYKRGYRYWRCKR